MSCVVGMVDRGDVYIGGDSGVFGDEDFLVMRIPKVFERKPFIFGTVGTFRAAQLLQFVFRVTPRKRGQDVYEYMITSFVEAVRTCWRSGGVMNSSVNEDCTGADFAESFLVGYEGRLFRLEADFSLIESASGFDAIGAGEHHARGALEAQELVLARSRRNKGSMTYGAPDRILDALTATSRANNKVRKPFVTVALKRRGLKDAASSATRKSISPAKDAASHGRTVTPN
jgi:hypothetical protein